MALVQRYWVFLLCCACSGGSSGGASADGDDPGDRIVIEVPRNRPRANGQDQGGHGFSAIESEKSPGDIRLSVATELGAELASRLNSPKAKALKPQESSVEIRDFFDKIELRDRESLRTQQIAVLESEKEEYHEAYMDLNRQQVLGNLKGASAAQSLASIVKGIDAALKSTQAELENLEREIVKIDREYEDLESAWLGRAQQKKAFTDESSKVTNRILQRQEFLLQFVRGQQPAGPNPGRDVRILIKKAQRRPFAMIVEKRLDAIKKSQNFWQKTFGKSDDELLEDAAANDKLFASVLDALDKIDLELSDLESERSDEIDRIRTLKGEDLIAKWDGSPADVEVLIARRDALQKWVEEFSHWPFPYTGPKDRCYWNGKFLSESEVKKELAKLSKLRSEKLRTFREISPDQVERISGVDLPGYMTSDGPELEDRRRAKEDRVRRMKVATLSDFEKRLKQRYSEHEVKYKALLEARDRLKATHEQNERRIKENFASQIRDLEDRRTVFESRANLLSDCFGRALEAATHSISTSVSRTRIDSVRADLALDQLQTTGLFSDVETPDPPLGEVEEFKRFLFLMIDDQDEIVAVESLSKPQRLLEAPEYRGEFSVPLSSLFARSYRLVLCTELQSGEIDVTSQKILIRER